MKKIFFVIIAALFIIGVMDAATSPSAVKVYLNPGHGSWGPNDRPMATIPYPNLASTGRPDTCGFYESNTNLWKVLKIGATLEKMGVPHANIKYSRVKNGPYPYTGTDYTYNRKLSVIAAEVEAGGYDVFISVHSNAATDGTSSNFPLLLYGGTDATENSTGSKSMCNKTWTRLYPLGIEVWSATSTYNLTKPNVRGDVTFYGSGSTTTYSSGKSYKTYLGVLRHGAPGYLAEGYYHTYQPARHRALNKDFCGQEGVRYARGVSDYFGWSGETTGYIMGTVKDLNKTLEHSLYKYTAGSLDAYLPINGALVRLFKEDGTLVSTYQVDNNYNGVFVFENLEPGNYKLDAIASGYKAISSPVAVTVVADDTVYPLLYLEEGEYVGESTSYEFRTEYREKAVSVLAGKTIRRTILRDNYLYVLALDASEAPYVYIINASTGEVAKTVSTSGLVAPTIPSGESTSVTTYVNPLALSDIQLTDDGVLLGCSKGVTGLNTVNGVDYSMESYISIYKWATGTDGLPDGDPIEWFKTDNSSNLTRAQEGNTFCYSGTSTAGTMYISSRTTGTEEGGLRATMLTIANGALSEISYRRIFSSSDVYDYTEAAFGTDFTFHNSPLSTGKILLSGSKNIIVEITLPTSTDSKDVAAAPAILKSGLITTPSAKVSFFDYNGKKYMVAGDVVEEVNKIKLIDVTYGFASASLVDVITNDEATVGVLAAAGIGLDEDTKTGIDLVTVNDGGSVTKLSTMQSNIISYELKTDYREKSVDVLADKTIRRAILRDNYLYVLALDASNVPYVYIINAETGEVVKTLDTAGLTVPAILETIPSGSSYNPDYIKPLALSDIQLTDDGVLLGCAKGFAGINTDGSSRGYSINIYKWATGTDDLPTGDPAVWFATENSSNMYYSQQGNTFCYTGTSTDGTMYISSRSAAAVAGVLRSTMLTIADGTLSAESYRRIQRSSTSTETYATNDCTEAAFGTDFTFHISPFGSDRIILTGSGHILGEIELPGKVADYPTTMTTLKSGLITTPSAKVSFFDYAGKHYMVAGDVIDDKYEIKLINITKGFANATLVDVVTTDEANVQVLAATGALKNVLDSEGTVIKSGFDIVTVNADGSITKLSMLERTAAGGVTYELNGGSFNPYGWTSKKDLFDAFMADAGITSMKYSYDGYMAMTNPFNSEGEATNNSLGSILTTDNIATPYANTEKWGWLYDYIKSVTGVADLASDNIPYWRYYTAQFLMGRGGAPAQYNFDFTEAGKDENYFVAWGYNYGNETNITSEYTLKAPYREGDWAFDGWYDNPEFTGSPYTVIDEMFVGTLYAKWNSTRVGITYNLNGGAYGLNNPYGWASKSDMFDAFMDAVFAGTEKTHLSLSEYLAQDNPITAIAGLTYNADDGGVIIANGIDDPRFAWLKDFLIESQNADNNAVPLSETVSETPAAYRFASAAFFVEGQYTTYPKSADFSELGKENIYLSEWGYTYDLVSNPVKPETTVTLNNPEKEGCTFQGWYTNRWFTGEAVTTVGATTNGTLDARWSSILGSDGTTMATLYCHYFDGKYVYASTIGNKGSNLNYTNTDLKDEYYSDKEEEFAQEDWVAIEGLTEEAEGQEIAIGAAYTKVADTKFPVISFTSPSLAAGASKDINTYRVANFNIGSTNSHVANIWLVAPQAGEYCTVGGYVAEVSGNTVTLASFVPGTNDADEDGPVEMVVDITNVKSEVKAGSWSSFTGVVEKGDGALVMNAYSYIDQPTGVEEGEVQSTVICGGQGEIVITTVEPLSVSVYTLGGALVVTRSLADSDAITVAPGIYVVKAGNKVEKVLVK
ncbi:MAG: SpaA isopeptide-forming pilin-related protein [Muribaculaceae bacterium]